MTHLLLAQLLATALANLPCESAASRAASIRAVSEDGQTEALLQAAARDFGAGILLSGEQELPAEQRRNRVAERMEQLCVLAERPAPETAVDRARLEGILARPEFARARARNADVLGRLIKWLKEFAASFFESEGAVTYSNITRATILGGAMMVSLLIALRVLRSRRRSMNVANREVTTPPLKLDDPVTHLARAREQLVTDARAAIREGLLALLSSLERGRLARPDRVKTNRELASELPARGASSDLCSTTEQLLSWYDRAFYSMDPVAIDAARKFLDDVDGLRQRIPGGGAS